MDTPPIFGKDLRERKVCLNVTVTHRQIIATATENLGRDIARRKSTNGRSTDVINVSV